MTSEREVEVLARQISDFKPEDGWTRDDFSRNYHPVWQIRY